MNEAGTAVGYSYKYVVGSVGPRAVSWDASGTAATELGNLGTNYSDTGYASALASAVNGAGTAVGYCEKYVAGTYLGIRAVRWDASETVATELGNLQTGVNATTFSEAFAVNSSGTAVGYAESYSGYDNGSQAVRWDARGTAAIELGKLSGSGGFTTSSALSINDAGIAVGYVNRTSVGQHAVMWGPMAKRSTSTISA